MSQLSNDELKAVVAVGNQLGLRLPAINLHDLPQDYPRRREILMVFEAIDPTTFVRMGRQSATAQPITAEAELARRGLVEVDQAIHDELMATDADYLQKQREAAVQREQEQLEAMDRMASEMARNQVIRQHGGDVAAADRFIRQQEAIETAKAEQKARDDESVRQMNERIAKRQAEERRMARMAQAGGITGVMQ
ncbi:hypothetical protein MITS9509_03501 [Synechococcus sp. MIT S9509]|uniref:hypothetical protein n=1 Tax=Synechococcus sp. MIT S9509 TaxID=1801630 RepID=UPI0007BB462A|nr:hypothetical protein [Synechococcus sp. MIT S9509]KZR86262.1 hypothetical protein MITS9509_03501 [Synechococcus sp. MIT S9509]